MNFLAIDTAGGYLTVVVQKGEESFSVFLPDCAMQHSVRLMGAIEEALQKADMRPDDCDFFSAVVGAGSFTGIRIAISAIKGFALALHKPTLPVTSFDIIAYNEVATDKSKILCLVDALHDCYYACGYENGAIVFPPAFLTEEEVCGLEKEGYALKACQRLPLSEKTTVQTVEPVTGLKNAVCALAEQNKFGDLKALYVRKSSAELNRV